MTERGAGMAETEIATSPAAPRNDRQHNARSMRLLSRASTKLSLRAKRSNLSSVLLDSRFRGNDRKGGENGRGGRMSHPSMTVGDRRVSRQDPGGKCA